MAAAPVDWLDYGRELGESIGRSKRPVCFVLGAGCSLSAGAPNTVQIDTALRRATRTRFAGVELRDAIHQLPELEKQDILQPLFAGVTTNAGYMAIASLAASRPVLVINLNWDLALQTAAIRVGVPITLVDMETDAVGTWPSHGTAGIIDVHVHGIVGHSCRYGRLETLRFTEAEEKWLIEQGLDHILICIGASLTYETDLTDLFRSKNPNPSARPQASRWFFVRGDPKDAEDALRRANYGVHPLTYILAPDIDFDKLATVIADSAITV
jgi:hypothetical protein